MAGSDLYASYIETHFHKARRTDSGHYTACCHIHDDKSPSLSIDPETGRVACHGCGYGGWMDEYAKEAHLPEPPSKLPPREEKPKKKAKSEKSEDWGTVVTSYVYKTAEGERHMKVERTSTKKFIQYRWTGSEWKRGLRVDGQKIAQLPYHLPEIVSTAEADKPIIWTEGEKDADMARGLGCCATTSPGGCGNAGKLDDWSMFSGRKVWILPDNDEPGEKYLKITAAKLIEAGATVRVCRLPGLGDGGDLFDWLAMGYGREQLAEQLDAAPVYVAEVEDAPAYESRPRVQVTTDILETAKETIEVLKQTGKFFFRRGQITYLHRRVDNREPYLEELSGDILRGYLAREIEFFSCFWNKSIKDYDEKLVFPSTNLIAVLHTLANQLPVVEEIREIPYVNRAGELVVTEQLDETGKILFLPLYNLETPETVEEETAKAAIAWLRYYFLGDFPFAEHYHGTHALAALFQPFLSPYINGPKPMFLADANQWGTGKTLLAQVIGGMSSPKKLDVLLQNPSEEKFAKEVHAELAKSQPCLILDDLKGNLNYGWLRGILTSTSVSFLLPYGKLPVSIPSGHLIIGTANNMIPHAETRRRIIPIRLVSDVERPECRSDEDFQIPDIEKFARDAKVEILERILHVLRYWIGRGRPPGTQTLGSYERWSRVFSGLFLSLGIEDFLQHVRDDENFRDETQHQWYTLIKHWSEMQSGPEDWRTAGDVMGMAMSLDLFQEAFDARSAVGAKTKMGRMLRDKIDNVIGGFVVRRRMGRKTSEYRLEIALASNAGHERRTSNREALMKSGIAPKILEDISEVSYDAHHRTSSFLRGVDKSGSRTSGAGLQTGMVEPSAGLAGLFSQNQTHVNINTHDFSREKGIEGAATPASHEERSLGDMLGDLF